jgi:hypothetical protein
MIEKRTLNHKATSGKVLNMTLKSSPEFRERSLKILTVSFRTFFLAQNKSMDVLRYQHNLIRVYVPPSS